MIKPTASIPLSIVLLASASIPLATFAQTIDVSARVEVVHLARHASPQSFSQSSSDVVVWLTPLEATPDPPPLHTPQYTLTQKDKMFHPHVLVVPVGSSVNFPNLDPFFHNVFSLFNGKRFDLGLYEAHTNRAVRFDREGVSFIFCNIHPDMGAVVVSLNTPYFALSSRDGTVLLRDVPPGRYRLNVWAENVPVDRLNAISRSLRIGPQANQLGTIHLESSGDLMTHHENKFGEAYPPPSTQPY